jgi:molecular chaperone GrpE
VGQLSGPEGTAEEVQAPGTDADTEAVDPSGAPPAAKAAEAVAARLAELEERHLRLLAEFENFRRRSAREMAAAGERAVGEAAAAFLPVLDNLERAEGAAAEAPAALREGIAMVLRQGREALGKLGLVAIPAAGEPFDPALHDAVGEVATDRVPPGHVAEVLRAGYRIGDRVVRPAMVRVAAAPGADADAAPEPAGTDPG